jgi:hypothetical protein
MPGWDEETFYAKFQAALLTSSLDWSKGVSELLDAWEYRPTRTEPLYELATGFRCREQYQQAFLFANRGLELGESDDLLFVVSWIYRWGLRFERSIAAYWIGERDLAMRDGEILAGMIDEIREPWRTHVLRNLEVFRQ